ncbi:MG2 domain-containing protein [Kiritimatiellaeota bacterium B1221]|nr:MG2 domain-containing protein [Kiritimatiellaeota bacterium B1221]
MKKSVSPFVYPLCFLLLNAFGLWQGLCIWQAHLEKASDPKVIHSPADMERLEGRAPVSWEWDQPVVAADQVGGIYADFPVSIDPRVSGVFRWESEKKLTFEPMHAWPVARRIQFEVQTLSTNTQQQVFALNHLSQVTGPRLEVRSAEPFLNANRQQVQIRIRLNAPVSPHELQGHVLLLDEEGSDLSVNLEETPQPDEFLLHAPWNGEKKLTLWVQSGLAALYGEDGGLAEDRSFEIQALDKFLLRGFEVEQPTFGKGKIELTFSDVPDLQSLMGGVRIEPEVRFSVGEGQWWRRQSCAITGDFEPGKKYQIFLSEGIRSLNGKSLGAGIERSVILPLREPGLKFAHSGSMLNAAGAKQLEVKVENEGRLDVVLERVHPNNLVDYAVRASGLDNWVSRRNPTENLGTVVWRKEGMEVKSGTVALDLSQALGAAGQGIYQLKVTGRNSQRQIEKIVAVSGMGLMARRNGDEIYVWALHLLSAEPVADLNLQLWSDTRQLLASGKTDARGLGVLKVIESEETGEALVLLAEKEGALGLLNLQAAHPFPGKNGARPYLQEGNEAFVYTERGMYRPQETVHARTIVRGNGFRLPGTFPVEWKLKNTAGLVVWNKQTMLSDVGTAEVKIHLQPEWPNGTYQLQVSLPGKDAAVWGQSTVHLESFVPPQIVVKADTPDGEVGVPEAFLVNIHAQMLYGAPAGDHECKATLSLQPEDFRSSEYPDYVFSDDRKDRFGMWNRSLGTFKTNAMGQHQIKVRVPADKVGPSALRAVVGISVKEFSGREATTFVSRRVDRVPYYVGLKVEGKQVKVVAVSPEGKGWEGSPELEMSWYRVSWQRGYRRNSRGEYRYYVDEVAIWEGAQPVQLEAGKFEVELDLENHAVYRVAVKDPVTGFSSSRRVYLGNVAEAPSRADQVNLSLDKAAYVPGEEAVLTMHAPFAGKGLVSIEDASFQLVETVALKERSGSFSFTVPECGAGNLWVRVSVVRPQPGGGAQPVLRSEGVLPLHIKNDDLDQPLQIEVAEELRPSETLSMRLMGAPGAEVVVAGVDEGILLLSDFETPNPLKWFLGLRRAGSLTWDSFNELLPELGPGILTGEVKMGGGFGSALRKRLNPVDAKRFKPLSWWSGAQRIPESGELELEIPLPEFTGQIRWMAVQVSEQGIGHAEAYSRVGREVIVQQSLPLFLAPGDETVWRFRLHNRSEEAKTLTLMPSAKGPVEFDATGLIFPLKPGEQQIREIKVKAKNEMGRADLMLRVKCGEEFWRETLEMAVRPAGSFETRVRRVLLAPDQYLTVEASEEMLPGTGKLTFQVSSMPTLQLAGARNFLLRYPYGCLEQTVSAVVPALYLPDWAEESGEGAKAQVEAGIHELWKKQLRSGGFGYWNGRDRLSVSGSFYALSFLLEAKAQGYAVHEASLQSTINWTRNWLNSQKWDVTSQSQSLKITQACRVLAMAGELDAGWLQILRERKEDFTAYARVVAAEALMRSGKRPLALEMLEGVSSTDAAWSWYSRTSGNAELLWLLLKLHPSDARIVPLVEDLLEKRNAQGRWAHTYENASVIRAFAAYAKAFPKSESGFQVGVGRKNVAFSPLRDGEFTEGALHGGSLSNQGDRPVYVEIVEEGFPVEPMPVKNAFQVKRTLLRLDGSEIKSGVAVRSGEMVMMRIKVSNLPKRLEHLVIDQPLPAGLEALPSIQQQKPWKRMQRKVDKKVSAARHVEVRDDRVFVFPWKVGHKSEVYYVLLRAVTPGDYVFPRLVSQDMYDDQMIFRGEEERLEVKL